MVCLSKLKDEIYQGILCTEEQLYPEFDALQRFCFDNQLADYEFDGARYLINSATPKNKENFLPSITLDGNDFGMSGYHFKKLPYEDFRFFFLGKFTGCCERLFEHCKNSVVHGYKTRESTFYVLTDPKDRIIAHSWVWISKDDYLVFDGFEANQNDRRISDPLIKKLLNLFSENIKQDPDFCEIKGIVLGKSRQGLAPHQGMKKIAITTHVSDMSKWVTKADEKNLGDFGNYIGYSQEFFIFKELRQALPDSYPSPSL